MKPNKEAKKIITKQSIKKHLVNIINDPNRFYISNGMVRITKRSKEIHMYYNGLL
jgi:hypothetical protein